VKEFNSNNYVIEVHDSMCAVSNLAWDALLATQSEPSPFMKHAYLLAMEESGSASAQTGWAIRLLTLRHESGEHQNLNDIPKDQGQLASAAVLYIKPHSY
jgi:predicted N-acyltransferase